MSFSGLLRELFVELQASCGLIESALLPADPLRSRMLGDSAHAGHWFIKCDHALPVAGSIKARGGIYEVLGHAEQLALQLGILAPGEDRVKLASGQARDRFSQHQILVGSTGNLGLSIGIMAAALGFEAIVHMSANAKPWKKQRLRAGGVRVVEHAGDFGDAVRAGREEARANPRAYFIDDENSRQLFLGYAVAALRVQRQLAAAGVEVDSRHPLFVYLPCGVGGAPGGITFGLRLLFGDAVHCFLAEPVAAPCMLVRLAASKNEALSVRDVGLDNVTEADGLAVARASEFSARVIRSLVAGVFTVLDDTLFEDLFMLQRTMDLRIEPSAAAGIRGPRWLLQSERGLHYQDVHELGQAMSEATHIIWTTGGALVPQDELARFMQRGQSVTTAR